MYVISFSLPFLSSMIYLYFQKFCLKNLKNRSLGIKKKQPTVRIFSTYLAQHWQKKKKRIILKTKQ